MTRPVVLITGASRRIGRAIAEAMAGRGWAVAVHYNSSTQAADEVVSAIVATGGAAHALRADLSDEDQVETLIDRTSTAVGPVTCLINNASLFEYDAVDTVSRKSWHDHLSVNLRAPFLLTQLFARNLPDGADGNVINILDQRVWNLTPHFVSYTLSKSALWTLTQTMALALAPNIRVNGIGPGPTLPSPRQSKQHFDRQIRETPLRKSATPGQIANAVQFILDAPAMTGQMIALDSGQHLGWAQPANRDHVGE